MHSAYDECPVAHKAENAQGKYPFGSLNILKNKIPPTAEESPRSLRDVNLQSLIDNLIYKTVFHRLL